MSSKKDNRVPPFARLERNTTLIFDQEGEMHYYIPEAYFETGQAFIGSPYTEVLGSFPYRIYDKNGKPGAVKMFNWPTIFICIPTKIVRKRNLVLDERFKPTDYRILIFKQDAQIISDINTPQYIDNARSLLNLHIITAKLPNVIPYNELYEYPFKSMELNGEKFSVHSQLMSMMYAKICRDPEDTYKEFRMSNAIKKSMIGYDTISIKEVPKYTSPYTAITSENMDESVIASVILSEDIQEGKTAHVASPLEDILTM